MTGVSPGDAVTSVRSIAEQLVSRMSADSGIRDLVALIDRPIVHEGLNIHSHPELCFVIRNTLLIDTHARTERLEPGHVLVVPPSVYHFAHAADGTVVTLWFACGERHMSTVLSEMRSDGKWNAIDAADFESFSQGSELLREVLVECDLRKPHWSRVCGNLVERFLLLVRRELDIGERRRSPACHRTSNLAERARGFILDNYTKALSLEDVAHYIGISPNYLANLYKSHFGTTVVNSIADARLSEARRLLDRTDKPVAVIADEVGYENASYFSRMFRSRTGVSPSQYRRRPE